LTKDLNKAYGATAKVNNTGICHICNQSIKEPEVQWSDEYPTENTVARVITVMYLQHQFDEESVIGQEFNEVYLHRRCFNNWKHKDQLISDWTASRRRFFQKKSKVWEFLRGNGSFALYRNPTGFNSQLPEVSFDSYAQLSHMQIPEEHWGILIEMLSTIDPEQLTRYTRNNPFRSLGDCFNLYFEGSYIVLLFNGRGIDISRSDTTDMRYTQGIVFSQEQWPAAYEFILSSSEFITATLQDPWTRIKVATVGSKIRESEEETQLMRALLYKEPAMVKNEFAIDLFLEAVRMAAITLIVQQAEYYDGVTRTRFIRLLENQIDERLRAIQDLALAAGKSERDIDSFSNLTKPMWYKYAMRIIEAAFVCAVKGKSLEVAKTLLHLASNNPNEAKKYSESVLREIQSLWLQYLSLGIKSRKD
jgi:hypothetical protein